MLSLVLLGQQALGQASLGKALKLTLQPSEQQEPTSASLTDGPPILGESLPNEDSERPASLRGDTTQAFVPPSDDENERPASLGGRATQAVPTSDGESESPTSHAEAQAAAPSSDDENERPASLGAPVSQAAPSSDDENERPASLGSPVSQAAPSSDAQGVATAQQSVATAQQAVSQQSKQSQQGKQEAQQRSEENKRAAPAEVSQQSPLPHGGASGEKKWEKKKHFMVISRPHNGAKWLKDMLNENSDVFCHGEPLLHKQASELDNFKRDFCWDHTPEQAGHPRIVASRSEGFTWFHSQGDLDFIASKYLNQSKSISAATLKRGADFVNWMINNELRVILLDRKRRLVRRVNTFKTSADGNGIVVDPTDIVKALQSDEELAFQTVPFLVGQGVQKEHVSASPRLPHIGLASPPHRARETLTTPPVLRSDHSRVLRGSGCGPSQPDGAHLQFHRREQQEQL